MYCSLNIKEPSLPCPVRSWVSHAKVFSWDQAVSTVPVNHLVVSRVELEIIAGIIFGDIADNTARPP